MHGNIDDGMQEHANDAGTVAEYEESSVLSEELSPAHLAVSFCLTNKIYFNIKYYSPVSVFIF